jgi:hypothetical protein
METLRRVAFGRWAEEEHRIIGNELHFQRATACAEDSSGGPQRKKADKEVGADTLSGRIASSTPVNGVGPADYEEKHDAETFAFDSFSAHFLILRSPPSSHDTHQHPVHAQEAYLRAEKNWKGGCSWCRYCWLNIQSCCALPGDCFLSPKVDGGSCSWCCAATLQHVFSLGSSTAVNAHSTNRAHGSPSKLPSARQAKPGPTQLQRFATDRSKK